MYLDSDKQMMIEFNPVYDIQLTIKIKLKKNTEKIKRFYQTFITMFRRMEFYKNKIQVTI